MRPCGKCGTSAMDGLFFCPQCGTRLDAPSVKPAPAVQEPVVDGSVVETSAPTIPSRNPPPMPSDTGRSPMLDDTTRAYGRDSAAAATTNFLPQRGRLRSIVVHPAISPYIARVASAVRAQRLSIGVVVEIAVLVACADNDVDDNEYTAIEDVVSAALGDIDMGVRSGVVDAAIAKLRSSSYDARTREVGRAIAAAAAAEEALVLAFALAFASGDLSILERGVIDALAEAMSAPVGALAQARSIVRGVVDGGASS